MAITPRKTDYNQWYLDVIDAGDLVDDAPVRGCKVLKPHGFALGLFHGGEELAHLVRSADGGEFAEGIDAFFAKRAPAFRSRR